MKYDEILRVRISSELKDSLRLRCGSDMSDYVRNLILRDLGVVDVISVDHISDNKKRLTKERLQAMVDGFKGNKG